MWRRAMTKAERRHDFAGSRIDGKLALDRGGAMPDKMLLHWSPRSPFVRKVMIVAHEVGLAEHIETVRTVVAAAAPNAELMKRNPQSRLPTLELADGTAIYDSRVICDYLDSLHDGARLFPQDFPDRLVALRRQALGDGMLDTLIMWRGEQLRPPAQQSIKHMQAWKLKTRASVDMLEEEADPLADSRFSIGHIALGVALDYIDFRFGELAWREGHPRLTAWHDTFAARPSVRANQPADEP
jgi:glutathione S-transferase